MEASTKASLCPLQVLGISQAEPCACGYCAFSSSLSFFPHSSKTYAPVITSTTPSTAQQWTLFEQELLLNISRVDECCAHFSQALDTHIVQVKAYRDLVISQLQQWKTQLSRDIAEAIVEVQAKLEGRENDLLAEYSVPLWLFRPGSLSLFTFEQPCTTPTDYSLLPQAAYRAPRPAGLKLYTSQSKAIQPKKAEEPPTLPHLSHSHITFFDFDTMKPGRAVKLERSVSVGYASLWAVVSPFQVFLCDVIRCMTCLVFGDGKVVSAPTTLFTHTEGGILV